MSTHDVVLRKKSFSLLFFTKFQGLWFPVAEIWSDRIKACSQFLYVDDPVHGDMIEKVISIPAEGEEYEIFVREQTYLGQYSQEGRMHILEGGGGSVFWRT